MIEENISKKDLLKNIKDNRKKLEDYIDQIPQEKMLDPVHAGWTIKDILAHIIAWEQNMIRWMTMSLNGEVVNDFPESREAVDALNEFQYQRDKDKGLQLILSEFPQSYVDAFKIAESVDEDALNDPGRFAWRKGRPIWFVIAANMYWHYEEHFEIFEKLINK